MKKPIRKVLSLLLAVFLLFGTVGNVLAVSQPRAVNAVRDTWYPTNIQAYTMENRRYTTYTQIGGPDLGYYVDGSDPVVINEVYTNGWVKITYPLTAGGYRTAYCLKSAFIGGDRGYVNVSANTNIYRRRDMLQNYGYVSPEDQFLLVLDAMDRLQVIYQTDSGYYKMGWMYF